MKPSISAKLLAVLTAAVLIITTFAACTVKIPEPQKTEEPASVATDVPQNTTGAQTNSPEHDVTDAPTDTPTDAPTDVPTEAPTEIPTEAPTDQPAPSLPGYYKLIKAKNGDDEYTEEQIAQMEEGGFYFYIIVNEDGTAVMYQSTLRYDFRWDETSFTEIESNEPAAYTLEGDLLTLSVDPVVYVFRRSNEEPPVIEDETPGELTHTERAGYYVLTGGKESGTELSKELLDTFFELGMKFFIVLEPEGTGFINVFGDESEIQWDDEKLYSFGSGITYSIENDVLTFGTDENNQYFLARSSEEIPVRGQYANSPITTGDNNIDLKHPEDINFAGQTIVDNDSVKVTATRIVLDDDSFGYGVEFTIENKTDKNLLASLRHAVVNGIEVDCMLYTEIAAGKTVTDSAFIGIDALLDNGGDDPSVIELYLEVIDSNDYFSDPLYAGKTIIYPMGEDKAGPAFERTPGENDVIMIDNDIIRIVYYDFKEYSYGYDDLLMYVTNKTDKDIQVSFDDVTADGEEIRPYFYYSIAPGVSGFTDAGWSMEDLNAKGIEKISKLRFTLTVTDNDEWAQLFQDTVEVTINK